MRKAEELEKFNNKQEPFLSVKMKPTNNYDPSDYQREEKHQSSSFLDKYKETSNDSHTNAKPLQVKEEYKQQVHSSNLPPQKPSYSQTKQAHINEEIPIPSNNFNNNPPLQSHSILDQNNAPSVNSNLLNDFTVNNQNSSQSNQNAADTSFRSNSSPKVEIPSDQEPLLKTENNLAAFKPLSAKISDFFSDHMVLSVIIIVILTIILALLLGLAFFI